MHWFHGCVCLCGVSLGLGAVDESLDVIEDFRAGVDFSEVSGAAA